MITPDRFTEFFQALYSYEPFPWQARLAKQVADGQWPELIDLPTASGKTACLDIAVFALAYQAQRPPAERTAPRRIAFVVDRRVIVDEAFERAKKLRDNLAKAPSGILREVANALRDLAGSDIPLQCFQLRGGMYRDDDWARTPTQPTILTSTVDQIGSRLLFRSYGFARNFTFPIHAGLTAYDMLIILDEAHCAQPFEQTIDAMQRYRQWMQTPIPLPGPFCFVTMTATPPEGKLPFGLQNDDRQHPVLKLRLNAPKPATLVVAGNPKDDTRTINAALAQMSVAQAERLAQKGLKAIGIMVNRVATARAMFAALQSKYDDKVLLLIGRMRPFDRDRTQNSALFQQLLADKSATRQLSQPMFVVATQTLEVGANLDFDGLVSECASLDAVRQRFGRLNRMGRNIAAEGVIVIRADQAKDSEEDPVYGAALKKTWDWLNTLSEAKNKTASSKGRGKAKAIEVETKLHVVNFGINALASKLKNLSAEERAGLSQETLDAPVMLPAHVDAWAQTAPAPLPEPDVSIFLHGPQRGTPEVQLVWRADLDETKPEQDWINTVALCAPTSVEALTAPLYLVKRWLRHQKADDDTLADVEGTRRNEDRDRNRNSEHASRPVLLWRGPKDSEVTRNPADIQPGDTLVIPTVYQGWEVFGHLLYPDAPDIAEAARWQAKHEAVLRLHPALLATWPDSDAKRLLLALARAEDRPEAAGLREAFTELAESGPEHLRPLFGVLTRAQKFTAEPHPLDGWVVIGKLPPEKKTEVDILPPFTDEDDSASLVRLEPGQVSLKDHCDGVTRFAVDFAKQCGLPLELVSDFELAGKFHDAGKADPRFQAWLYACNGQRFVTSNRPLIAKSTPANREVSEENRARVGYPKGARHELLSVSLIQHDETLKARAHDWDLILHLIASHHGRCRPFAPVVDDPNPAQVEATLYEHPVAGTTRTNLERLDSGVADRFWKLTRKYGWWGLAYLEAIFRLADHRQSQRDTGR